MKDARTDKKARQPFRLQEHVEWISMAFVLALTLRCFVVEAYQIPTGSMAPTLYGKHFEVECLVCRTSFVVRGADAGEYLVGFVCPACGEEGVPRERRLRLYGGDRILVAKDLYLFSKPRRWDVFIFKSPEEGSYSKNFVKRLVGLPGETLELRNGQVFIDGHIVRKPEKVQEAMWQPVYDRKTDVRPHWKSDGAWQYKNGKLALTESVDSWHTVEYADPILDFYGYNGRQGDNVVTDLLVRGHVNIDEDQASFAVSIADDSNTYKAIFTPVAGRVEVELRRNEELISQVTSYAQSPRDFDFSFAVVDGAQVITVDGMKAVENAFDLTPRDVPLFSNSSGVFFSGFSSAMLVGDVEIKRDVYYCITPARPDRYAGGPFIKRIPDGNYFGLGDNSPKSNDSRIWGPIPEANVIGKAFVVFWPPSRVKPTF